MGEVSNRRKGGSGAGRLADVAPRDFFDELAHELAVVIHAVVENPGQPGSDSRHRLQRGDHLDELRVHDGENAAANQRGREEGTGRKPTARPAWSARSRLDEGFLRSMGAREAKGRDERTAGGTSRRMKRQQRQEYLIGNSEGEEAPKLSPNGEQEDFDRVVQVLSPVKIIREQSLFLLPSSELNATTFLPFSRTTWFLSNRELMTASIFGIKIDIK